MARLCRFALAYGFLFAFALAPVNTVQAQESTASGTDADARRHLGAPVNFGQGVARTIVRTNDSGEPVALGVEFTPGVLEGLPQKRAEDRSLGWHQFLAFPPDAPETGFNHLMMNWHPEGHHPDKIYAVPHFDFHFYVIDWDRQLGIRYPNPMTPDTAGVTKPSGELVPDEYVIPPATQVNEMGLHAVPKSAPELQGKPFVHTFMYGYEDGDLVFLEPMVTHEFLASRRDHARALPTPERYGASGWYPTEFRIAFDEEEGVYRVMLEGLRRSED